MKRLEYGYGVAAFCKFARARKPRGAASYNRHLFSAGHFFFYLIFKVFKVVIGYKSFKVADSYAFTLYTSCAYALALAFLRTNPAANRRQRRGALDNFIRLFKFTFCNFGDKIRYGYTDGAF